ncbi:1,2-dihydroxy-3-keto-5-methylthiopentene dioxygenase [Pseudoalteromonas xiamenensis]|uniref:Acireductone dioxygenase n=1 Tax=Pseudoalteromonas xiamenensis TaxID=882626 RepID=A0A975DEP1_9GAMM|nr:acireductone dioxygenase [Pseudoalteromonas xiamenensis]QTH70189.1 acireductone dioxygenase [Pseudoalteromonas xiamenensis]
MNKLTIFNAIDPSKSTLSSNDAHVIATTLATKGVRFEQWQATTAITPAMEQTDVIAAYRNDIARLQADGGYQTVDVISLAKGNPDAAQLRQKFLFEHTHGEDEVRFFVKGQGLFCLHIADEVIQVLCQQGDLIAVPALTPHWFDMGPDPEFTAIRLFNNPEGWVAKATGSPLANEFPLLD